MRSNGIRQQISPTPAATGVLPIVVVRTYFERSHLTIGVLGCQYHAIRLFVAIQQIPAPGRTVHFELRRRSIRRHTSPAAMEKQLVSLLNISMGSVLTQRNKLCIPNIFFLS